MSGVSMWQGDTDCRGRTRYPLCLKATAPLCVVQRLWPSTAVARRERRHGQRMVEDDLPGLERLALVADPRLTAMSDHIEFTKRRARKTWPCQASDHACRGPIEPGDRYVQVDHGQGRARTTRRYAWACAALAFGGDFMRVLDARGVVPPARADGHWRRAPLPSRRLIRHRCNRLDAGAFCRFSSCLQAMAPPTQSGW